MKITTILAIATLSLTFACGGGQSKTASEPAADTPAQSGPADPQATCVSTFERARECTDEYIPALVDLRISLDVPAGIAQAAQTDGRDALIATAKEEWKTDSEPAAVTANCQQMTSAIAAEQASAMADQLSACLPAASCSEFVQCVTPVQEAMLRAQAGQQAQ